MTDTPIVEQGFKSGVDVVDIGDLRVARGLTRRPYSSCKHHRVVYDSRERRIWCQDCESEVEPFDAFETLVEQWNSSLNRIKKREVAVSEAEKFTARSRAAKVMDKAWLSRVTVPCCPHCTKAIMPDDVTSGLPKANRKLEMARRAKQEQEKK